jgi:hypothetical protein
MNNGLYRGVNLPSANWTALDRTLRRDKKQKVAIRTNVSLRGRFQLPTFSGETEFKAKLNIC